MREASRAELDNPLSSVAAGGGLGYDRVLGRGSRLGGGSSGRGCARWKDSLMKRTKGLAALLAAWLVAGCGLTVNEEFANQLFDPEGNALVLQDLQAIPTDASLSQEQQRQAFRDLGIEDERLIDALMTLTLPIGGL